MLKIKNYIKVQSLEEAYELNQKRTARVLGGMTWARMGSRITNPVIDLSGLGLDTIEETEEEFLIGCMVRLRDLELHQSLNNYTQGAMKESVKHIVGVQFRNCATVGGSIFGRFGFSDVLTMFLALDTEVELYRAGRIPLEQFASQKKDRDILVRLVVKKTPLRCAYLSQRNTETDFPVLTCAAALVNGEPRTVIGARPFAARRMTDPDGILQNFMNKSTEEQIQAAAEYASYLGEHVHTASNIRGSAEYRTVLTEVLTRRAWNQIGGQANDY